MPPNPEIRTLCMLVLFSLMGQKNDDVIRLKLNLHDFFQKRFWHHTMVSFWSPELLAISKYFGILYPIKSSLSWEPNLIVMALRKNSQFQNNFKKDKKAKTIVNNIKNALETICIATVRLLLCGYYVIIELLLCYYCYYVVLAKR